MFHRKAKSQHGTRKCLGTKVADPITKEAKYKWKNYNEVDTEVQTLANLIQKNEWANEVHDDVSNKTIKTIGICSVNREEWLVTDLACNLLDITSVPLYETLGDEILNIILD